MRRKPRNGSRETDTPRATPSREPPSEVSVEPRLIEDPTKHECTSRIGWRTALLRLRSAGGTGSPNGTDLICAPQRSRAPPDRRFRTGNKSLALRNVERNGHTSSVQRNGHLFGAQRSLFGAPPLRRSTLWIEHTPRSRTSPTPNSHTVDAVPLQRMGHTSSATTNRTHLPGDPSPDSHIGLTSPTNPTTRHFEMDTPLPHPAF